MCASSPTIVGKDSRVLAVYLILCERLTTLWEGTLTALSSRRCDGCDTYSSISASSWHHSTGWLLTAGSLTGATDHAADPATPRARSSSAARPHRTRRRDPALLADPWPLRHPMSVAAGSRRPVAAPPPDRRVRPSRPSCWGRCG